MMVQKMEVNWLKMLNYHHSSDFFKKKLRRTTTLMRMFSYETEDQPLDDRKKAHRDQCFNIVLYQAIQSTEFSVDLNIFEAK